MTTAIIPAQLAVDLANILTRLRHARETGDIDCEIVAENRLNALLDKLPRKDQQ